MKTVIFKQVIKVTTDFKKIHLSQSTDLHIFCEMEIKKVQQIRTRFIMTHVTLHPTLTVIAPPKDMNYVDSFELHVKKIYYSSYIIRIKHIQL